MRALFVVALTLVLAPATALARTSQDYPYPVDQAWNASLRLVRVDLRCPVTDRDQDSGYLLFDYVDGSHTYPGSVELVHTRVEGRDGARVVVQIPAMPSYVERMILDRLARKLVEDFGEPAPAPRPPPAAPPDAPTRDRPGQQSPADRPRPAPGRSPSPAPQRPTHD